MAKKKRTESWDDASDKSLNDESDLTPKEGEEGDLDEELEEEADEAEEENY